MDALLLILAIAVIAFAGYKAYQSSKEPGATLAQKQGTPHAPPPAGDPNNRTDQPKPHLPNFQPGDVDMKGPQKPGPAPDDNGDSDTEGPSKPKFIP